MNLLGKTTLTFVLLLLAWGGSAAAMGWNDVLVQALQNKQLNRALDALAQGATKDAKDDDGFTALYYAVRNDMPEVTKILLEKGAKAHAEVPDEPDQPGGQTLLHVAAREGSVESFKLLLEHGADPLYEPFSPTLGPPIYHAAIHDQGEIIRLLCAAGVDPNDRKTGGQLPLVSAAAKGKAAAVRALLECGADPTMVNTMDEMDAFMAGERSGNAEVIALLKDAPKVRKQAASENAAPSGTPVSSPYGGKGYAAGDTRLEGGVAGMPIWVWVLIGVAALAVLVMSARASNSPPYTPPPDKEIALEPVEPVLKPRWEGQHTYGTIAPAPERKKTPDSLPGLVTAAERGEVDTINELLGNITSLGTRQKLGAIPLCAAAEQGHPEAVEALLGYGVPPDALNADGIPALWLAVQNNHPAVVRALLDHGATFGADRSGAPLLALAAELNALEVARHLLKHGADAHTADGQGRTPGQIARARGHAELAGLLGG